MAVITIEIKRKYKNNTDGFEGIVKIEGLARTKVSKKDKSTFFKTRSALKHTAKKLNKLKLKIEYIEHKAPCSKVKFNL